MSSFEFLTPATGGRVSSAFGGVFNPAVAAAVAPPPRSSTVFVEVRPQSTVAEVARAGSLLPSVAIDDQLVASVLDELVLVPTKVVSQSVAAGVAVPQGTAIDIVLARPIDMPATIITGIHPALQGLSVAAIGDQFIAAQPAVRDIVRRKTAVDDLTEAERATVTTALADQGVFMSDRPGEDFDAAYKGLQAGLVFLG